MRSSFSTFNRSGMPSGPGSSSDRATGSQKRRNSSPMGVPASVLVTSSLSSFVSMREASFKSDDAPHISLNGSHVHSKSFNNRVCGREAKRYVRSALEPAGQTTNAETYNRRDKGVLEFQFSL